MVPMRDGVRLAVDVYLPAVDGVAARGRFPAVLVRTSIGKRHPEWDPILDYYPAHGYALVIQDLRSRFDSEGDGRYYHTCNPWEGEDGYDTVEWIAKQPWCTGKVGMIGSSHRGMVQIHAALHRPPHLAAICPEQPPTRIYAHEAREGGAMQLHMYAALYVHALDSQETRDRPEAVARMVDGMRHLKEWLQRFPLEPGKTPLSGAPCMEETFFNYYRRGEYDEWWAQEVNDNTAYFDRHADIPVFITGGWYDTFSPAVTHYFQTMTRQNRSKARLLIGPWTHGQMRTPASWCGDVDFGPASVWGYPRHSELRVRWFDRWLKGERNGVDDDPPVEIFVMGGGSGRKNPAGRLDHGGAWRAENEWPLARTEYRTYYMHGDGALSAQAPAVDGGPLSFTFDPARPVPTAGGNICAHLGLTPFEDGSLPAVPPCGERIRAYGPHLRSIVPWGPLHQVEAPWMIGVAPPYRLLRDRPDVLVFEAPPLTRDLEVTGPIEVNLWVSSTALDTDFTAKLLDVYPPSDDYPDGYHLLLVDSIIRCRYRNSWSRPELMEPGEVYRVRIDVSPTSNLFKAGHRIRVDISSSNFPRFDVNPNTGEPMGRHTHTVVARNTVYTDAGHPSHIVLPLIPA
jgi:putative CocE/NonD family hydrolase